MELNGRRQESSYLFVCFKFSRDHNETVALYRNLSSLSLPHWWPCIGHFRSDRRQCLVFSHVAQLQKVSDFSELAERPGSIVSVLSRLETTAGDSRYFLVVVALDPQSTCCAMHLLWPSMWNGMYTALKQLLLRGYSCPPRKSRYAAFSSWFGWWFSSGSHGRHPEWLDSDDGGFLLLQIFLHQLPSLERPGELSVLGDFHGLSK